jgi:hypothetical protein
MTTMNCIFNSGSLIPLYHQTLLASSNPDVARVLCPIRSIRLIWENPKLLRNAELHPTFAETIYIDGPQEEPCRFPSQMSSHFSSHENRLTVRMYQLIIITFLNEHDLVVIGNPRLKILIPWLATLQCSLSAALPTPHTFELL